MMFYCKVILLILDSQKTKKRKEKNSNNPLARQHVNMVTLILFIQKVIVDIKII